MAERRREGALPRLADLLGRFRGRHPKLTRALRLAYIAGSWAMLAWFVVALIIWPVMRYTAVPWLWAYWALFQLFLLSRTKTLSWRFAGLTVTAGMLVAPLAGGVSLGLARVTPWVAAARDGGVYLAPLVEETVKLLPLAVILLVARRRVRGFAVVDYLLVGFAAGLGVTASEEIVRRVGAAQLATSFPGGIASLPVINAEHGIRQSYGFWFTGAGTEFYGHTYVAGHHVFTGLVCAAIGLAVWWGRCRDTGAGAVRRPRWWPAVWLLPVLAWALAVADHTVGNYVASSHADTVTVSHDAHLPRWLLSAHQWWGAGHEQQWLLVAVLVAAVVIDARRIAYGTLLAPPLPAVAWVGRLHAWFAHVASSLRAGLPRGATEVVVRAVSRAAAGIERVGMAVRVLLHQLALLWIAAGRAPGASGPRRPYRWVATIAYLRARREDAMRATRRLHIPYVSRSDQGPEDGGEGGAAGAPGPGGLPTATTAVIAAVVLAAGGAVGRRGLVRRDARHDRRRRPTHWTRRCARTRRTCPAYSTQPRTGGPISPGTSNSAPASSG